MQSRIEWPGARSLMLCIVVSLLHAGCAWTEHRRLEQAQADYEQCVEGAGGDAARCAEKRRVVDARYDEYERASRARWSCNPQSGECPEPRR